MRQAEEKLCGRDAVQIRRVANHPIDLEQIAGRWTDVGRVQVTRFFVRLFPDDRYSLTLFRDGRTVITGTTEISQARSLYDRYVGG
jgi:adenylyltransferase/sulfurtransferase